MQATATGNAFEQITDMTLEAAVQMADRIGSDPMTCFKLIFAKVMNDIETDEPDLAALIARAAETADIN